MNTNGRPHDAPLARHTLREVISGRRTTRRTLLLWVGSAASTLALGSTISQAAAKFPSTIPTRPASAFDAAVPTAWFDLILKLIQTTPGFSPPVASRALGYLGVALYEALVPGMSGYRSLAGQLNTLAPTPLPHDPAHHWPSVANAILAAMVRRLFPTTSSDNLAAIDALEGAIVDGFAGTLPHGIAKRSRQRGQQVASHIFNWSTTDGGHEGYLTNFPTSYVPPVGPGLWEPTPPGFLPALQPFWGNNRPFVLPSGAAVDPGPPPQPYSEDSSSPFYAEAVEVYDVVNHLTDEQREIALFWADDPGATATPPGHAISILTQTLRQQDARLDLAAEAYAKVGMAVADAFIACWASKYRYHLPRPITYIQRLIDPAWGNPLPVTTPPFPEYTSGHSVQMGAAMQVLVDLFGDFPLVDHTHDQLGLAPRSFASCAAMAEEAAISRLYGGIHFRPAIEIGVEQGRAIGRRVNALRLGSR